MRRILLQMVLVFLIVSSASGQELSLSDTLSSSKNDLPTLLKSNDYQAKVNFLNKFYSPAYLGGLKSYTEDIQLDSIVVNAWSDESQAVEKTLRYTCSFENDGKSVLVSIYAWDESDSKWTIGDENYYEFNEDGKVKQVEFQKYVSPEYRLYTRIDYEYENDLLTFESKYDRIDEIEVWDEVEQLEYQYNGNNSLMKVYVNEWDIYEDDWIANAYRIFEYDSIGNLETKIGFDYDYFAMLSTKKFELKYVHDENANIVEIKEYVPGWEEGVYVPERWQAYVFDTTSNIESETFYNWSYDADGWIGEVQRLYSGETDGTQIYEASSYLWITENQKWQGSERLEYLAENNYSSEDIQNWEFLKIYMPVYSFNDLVCDKIEKSSHKDGNWKSSGWTDYYFSDGTMVGINEMETHNIKVYPNPVIDALNIEIDNFEETTCVVRNLNGQIVLQSNFQKDIQINVLHLKFGLYIVELYSKNHRIYTDKIIKN